MRPQPVRTCHYCHEVGGNVTPAPRPAILGGGQVDAHPGCTEYALAVTLSGASRAVAKALAYLPQAVA
jgi:hypothetical protein